MNVRFPISTFLTTLSVLSISLAAYAKVPSDEAMARMRERLKSDPEAARYLDFMVTPMEKRGDFTGFFGSREERAAEGDSRRKSYGDREWGQSYLTLRSFLPQERYTAPYGMRVEPSTESEAQFTRNEIYLAPRVDQSRKMKAYQVYLSEILPEFLATNPPVDKVREIYKNLADTRTSPESQRALVSWGLANAATNTEYSEWFATSLGRKDTPLSREQGSEAAVVDAIAEYGRRFYSGEDPPNHGPTLLNMVEYVAHRADPHWNPKQILKLLVDRLENGPPDVRLTKAFLNLTDHPFVYPPRGLELSNPEQLRAKLKTIAYWKVQQHPELESLKEDSSIKRIGAQGTRGEGDTPEREDRAVHSAAQQLAHDHRLYGCGRRFSSIIDALVKGN